MKKKLVLFAFVALFSFIPHLSFSQEDGEEDWDSIFQDGEDIEVEQNENTDGTKKTGWDKALSDDLSLPLRFSGNLQSSLGGYFNYLLYPNDDYVQDEVRDFLSGYFTLSNDLFLTARIDNTLSFRARINTSFPGDTTILRFKELYCDYLFLDRVYFTLGRKKSVWGYTRIFSSGDTYKNEKVLTDSDVKDAINTLESGGFLHTDILYDTADSISAMIRIPIKIGMLSAIFYYDLEGGNYYPSMEDLKIAASVELTFFHTTFNVFGKKYDEKETEYSTTEIDHYIVTANPDADPNNPKPEDWIYTPVYKKEKKITQTYPLLGMEVKRTFFGYDFYAQAMASLMNWREFEMQKVFATAGFYKIWDSINPTVGINIEYQYGYDFVDYENHNRLALDFGLSKLGKKDDLKLFLKWQHVFDDTSGSVKVVFIKSGIWPHCNWENALEYRYNDEKTGAVAKFQLLTSLKINVDY